MKKLNIDIDFGLVISIFVILIGITIIIYFVVVPPFNGWSINQDPNLLSQYGALIGGIVGPLFTLAGFILIFKTFVSQNSAQRKQNYQWLIQQQLIRQERFETTFFNLLNNQISIVNDLKVYFKSLQGIHKEVFNAIIGREFFAYSIKELNDIWNSLNKKEYSGYYDPEIAEYKQQKIDDLYNPNSKTFTHPDDAIVQEKQIKYNVRLTQVNKYYGIDGKTWDSFKKLNIAEKINLVYGLYFKKFHYAAGHYFRHLYHILDFLEVWEKVFSATTDNKDNLVKVDINKYASFIQSQMTSFELCLLYYNAFSFPKMLRLVKKYNILENLTVEDLISDEHWFDKEVNLKKREDIIRIKN